MASTMAGTACVCFQFRNLRGGTDKHWILAQRRGRASYVAKQGKWDWSCVGILVDALRMNLSPMRAPYRIRELKELQRSSGSAPTANPTGVQPLWLIVRPLNVNDRSP